MNILLKRKNILMMLDIMLAAAPAVLLTVLDLVIGIGYISWPAIIYQFAFYIALIMVIRSAVGIYHSIWRYASAETYMKLLLADMAAALSFHVIGQLFAPLEVRMTYITVMAMGTLIETFAIRFCYQIYYAHKNVAVEEKDGSASQGEAVSAAIVGAGNVGASLAETLLRNPKANLKPCVFIDQDPQKIGNSINGIRILADDDAIVDKLKTLNVKEIIIAIPDASPEEKNALYNKYIATGCRIKIYDYPLSDVREGTIREFKIEDLLFRDSLTVTDRASRTYYTGRRVLVTGGGGSIGSEICRQIAAQQPEQLVILDIYENNAYDIQQELIRNYAGELNLETVIASVRDRDRMDEVFDTYRPEIVIHAAAHKHVPLMEENAAEAIKNNVVGTYNAADMAEKYGAEKFLLISTDKAVNPTNVMGASKRVCEMIVQSRGDSKTSFAAVRFGNVLGSNGSVIPLFKRQIKKGGPVTLTDRRIIRYFMTIEEACQLVLQTAAMARRGELFVLDMGKPVRILDLAENMIRLSGLVPYKDIDIVEIGLRPGEKLYEELLMKSEELDRTENGMIFVERDKPLSREEVRRKIGILTKAASSGSYDEIISAITDTVPTYRNADEVNSDASSSEEMKATE